jgi:hypothetical protein
LGRKEPGREVHGKECPKHDYRRQCSRNPGEEAEQEREPTAELNSRGEERHKSCGRDSHLMP